MSSEGSTTRTSENLIDRVRVNPNAIPEERETTWTVPSDKDCVRVHTEIPSLIRRFLLHPEFDVDHVGVMRDGSVEQLEMDEALETDGKIVRLKGHIPVRFLSVHKEGRKQNSQADIVSQRVLSNKGTNGGGDD